MTIAIVLTFDHLVRMLRTNREDLVMRSVSNIKDLSMVHYIHDCLVFIGSTFRTEAC